MRLKLSLFGASFVLVGAANAVTFNFQSAGMTAKSGATLDVLETNVRQYLAPSPSAAMTLVSLSYSIPASFVGTHLMGSTTGGIGTLTVHDAASNSDRALNFTFSALLSRTSGTSLDNVSFSSTSFTLSGLDGTGSGTLSGNLANGGSKSTFMGNVAVAPEPGSLAALVLGGAAVVRRRRRA